LRLNSRHDLGNDPKPIPSSTNTDITASSPHHPPKHVPSSPTAASAAPAPCQMLTSLLHDTPTQRSPPALRGPQFSLFLVSKRTNDVVASLSTSVFELKQVQTARCKPTTLSTGRSIDHSILCGRQTDPIRYPTDPGESRICRSLDQFEHHRGVGRMLTTR
jgi:hypothetical protein